MVSDRNIIEWHPEALAQLPQEIVQDMIRKRLAFPEQLMSQIRGIDLHDWKTHHRRFEFSGYEDKSGEVTVHNMSIVNEFADVGIYDYTRFLIVDFAKGDGTIFLRYYWNQEEMEVSVGGFSTSEIIYEIFKLTIFSGNKKRRRI